MSEVALSLGYRSSSRSNVHRQVAKLRPVYIDETSGSRSLRLTPVGIALLDGDGMGAADPAARSTPAQPVSGTILPLLASGLTAMAVLVDQGKPIRAPYPFAWQRGLNILASECLLRDITPPGHTPEAVDWCHRPPSAWPVRFSAGLRSLSEPLLVDGTPTDFCRELAQGLSAGNAERELCERLMAKVRHQAQVQRSQAAYVAVRQYLIEHPVTSHEELLDASFAPEMGGFGGDLAEMYEEVPLEAFEDGHLLLCGHCGWTLQRRNGRLRCGDERCRLLTENFTRGTRERAALPDGSWVRARKAIRRYIVAPGTYELAAARRIGAMGGVSVELWPGFDRYDLRIIFPDGEIWAVDVKDWRYPHLLARHLQPLATDGGCHWDRAFYAVPDERVRDNASYLTFLRNAVTQTNFQIVTISELIEAVRVRKQQEVPHARV